MRRELDEEIGIDVLAAEPWLELVHDYPDKRVLLDVWRVLDYRGEVSAREGQALDWVGAAQLAALPLLPADLPIVAALIRGRSDLTNREQEADVLVDLNGPLVDAAPAQEAHREPVLPRANLGIETGARGQQHADEVHLLVADDVVLKEAADRDLVGRYRSPRA